MQDAVNGSRRPYRARRRAEQADATRREIVTAAGRLFRERGYGVAMTDIAAEAGVAVETAYRIFGTKAGLFTAAVEALLAGGAGRAEVAVEDRPAIRAIREERDPARQVALYAATQPGVHRRAGPLLRALRDARAADSELSRLWERLEARRLEGQARFVAELASCGVLRPALSTEEATDLVWTLCSLAVHDLLVLGRGWSEDRYEVWLTSTLIRELLG
jgi:AcrR family transcriptional regulator